MKNPERLIGKKVRGFKFYEACFLLEMSKYVGEIGIVKDVASKYCKIEFKDGYWAGYPTDQIEAHLVEEIPTLSDGVMMLVSSNNISWNPRKVIGQKKDGFYFAWDEKQTDIYKWKYAKPIEPTKEEQLTAILGSSDKVSEIMELFNCKE